MSALYSLLTGMDGAGYGRYKQLRGTHQLTDRLELSVDRVQADPYAPPSLIQVRVPLADTGIAAETVTGPGATAVADYLTRRVVEAIAELGGHGGKNSGSLSIDTPRQQVLERSSVVFPGASPTEVVVRMEAALPAQGRRIRGRAAATLLTEKLPKVIDHALLEIDHAELDEIVALYHDQLHLREQLLEHELVGFVANGSVLPRAAGNSDLPADRAVPFESPTSLERRFELPSGRVVTGMGIPRGVCLIVGGGYHGKSTLLRALERGVYNHVLGDGRELVVTVDDAIALRAEDGRGVVDVEISTFIADLPDGTDTSHFSSTNASGSTSQAASLMEGLEAGTTALLIDEDTSATNFMIRDDRMRQLVPAHQEPITPLLDRVRALWEDRGVSTILVAGGSGAFIDVADRVLLLDHYRVTDITERAHQLAEPIAPQQPFPAPRRRVLRPTRTPNRSASRFRGPKPPRAKGTHTIRHGQGSIELSALSQLVDPSQTNSIAAILALVEAAADGQRTLVELVQEVFDRMAAQGLETISPHKGHPGRLAAPRFLEVVAAINRNRDVTVVD